MSELQPTSAQHVHSVIMSQSLRDDSKTYWWTNAANVGKHTLRHLMSDSARSSKINLEILDIA